VVDPILAIEEYGCDALRSALVQGTTPGQDVSLDMERVKAQRNFVNKLWNAGRYISLSLSQPSQEQERLLSVTRPLSAEQLAALPLAERYICSRCHEVAEEATTLLESFLLSEALRAVSDFIWDEFADWYLEVCLSLPSRLPELTCPVL
jgi:valyl-tRNA synthetase